MSLKLKKKNLNLASPLPFAFVQSPPYSKFKKESHNWEKVAPGHQDGDKVKQKGGMPRVYIVGKESGISNKGPGW